MSYKDEISNWEWNRVIKYYGSCHSSIIGLISYLWTEKPNRTILDSPPRLVSNSQEHYCDLFLLDEARPIVCVEVETTPEKYREKYNNLKEHMNQYATMQLGLLALYNNNPNKTVNHHVFDDIVELWKNDTANKSRIIIITIDKEPPLPRNLYINAINKAFYSFPKKLPLIYRSD